MSIISEQILERLGASKFTRVRKSIFKFYRIYAEHFDNNDLKCIRRLITLLGDLLVMVQVISLFVLSQRNFGTNRNITLLQYFFSITRFDLFSINQGYELIFILIVGILLLVEFLCFLLVFTQIYIKINYFRLLLITLYSLIDTVFQYLVFVPFVFYSSANLVQIITRDSYYNAQYGKTIDYDPYGIVYFFMVPFCVVLRVSNLLFIQSDKSHSKVCISHFMGICLVCIMSMLLPKTYFYLLGIALGVYMIKKTWMYFPFYSFFRNMLIINFWATIGLLSFILLISENLNQGNLILFSLVLVVPGAWVYLKMKSEAILLEKISKNPESPYEVDIQARNLVKNNKFTEALDLVIRFQKFFPYFDPLHIWEFEIGLKISEENAHGIKIMALKSLDNTYFGALEHNNTLHRPKIESDFKVYSHFKNFKRYGRNNRIKYIKDLLEFKVCDYKNCRSLYDFISHLLNVTKNGPKNIVRTLTDFRKIQKFQKQLFLESQKKYRNDYLFKNIFSSINNTLNESSGTKSGMLSIQLETYQFKDTKETPELILDITCSNKILYINTGAIKEIKIELDEFIFRPFDLLIPEPLSVFFWSEVQKVLLKRTSNDTVIKNFFVKTGKGYYLGANFELNICVYKGVPYLHINIIPKPSQKFIGILVDGTVVSFSNHFKRTLVNVSNLIEVYPDLYWTINDHKQGFEHKNSEEDVVKIERENHGQEVITIFFSDSSIKFVDKNPSSINFTQLSPTNKLQKKQSLSSSSVNPKLKPLSPKQRIKKILNTLMPSVSILLFIAFVLCLIIIVLVIEFIENSNIYNISLDLCKMRTLIVTIGNTVRSHELCSEGYPVYYSLDFYESYIENCTNDLEMYLNNFRTYDKTYPVSQSFLSTQILLWELEDGTPVSSSQTLYQSLVILIQNSNKYVKNFQSRANTTDQRYFIYHNAFSTIIDRMNQTVWEDLNGLNGISVNVYNLMYGLELSSITPTFLLIIVLVVFMYLLEKINTKQWKIISNVNSVHIKILEGQILSRLKDLHCVSLEKNEEIDRKKVYSRIWLKYILNGFFMLIISSVFTILGIYYTVTQLQFILDLSTNHIFWGGLRSSITVSNYFWGREIYNYNWNSSLSSIIINDHLNEASLDQAFEEESDDLDKYEHSIFMSMSGKNQNGLNVDDYVQLLLGDNCGYFNITDCTKLPISKGLDPGLAIYELDIEYFVALSYEGVFLWDLVQKNEFDTFAFEIAWNTCLVTFNTITGQALNQIQLNVTLIFCCYAASIVLSYIFIIVPALKRLRSELLSKTEIISILAAMPYNSSSTK